MKLLEEFFASNDDWSNELIEEIAIKTKLKVKQVSKWYWDQTTKGRTPSSRKNWGTGYLYLLF